MRAALEAAGCPFCKLVMERVTTGRGIEQIGSSGVYHFEPLNPVTPGHRLFVPAFHYEDAAEAPSATGAVFEWAAWWAAQQDEDFNLIVNAGPAASQTVRHLHIHYVPRRPSDGLILPWSSLAEKRAEWEAEQEDLDNCCDVRGGQDRCGDCPKDRGRTRSRKRAQCSQIPSTC